MALVPWKPKEEVMSIEVAIYGELQFLTEKAIII
jgi:hypothetical protein